MSDETRAALRCGTLTGLDIEQIRAARARLCDVCETIPGIAFRRVPGQIEPDRPLLTMRVAVLAGVLVGLIGALLR